MACCSQPQTLGGEHHRGSTPRPMPGPPDAARVRVTGHSRTESPDNCSPRKMSHLMTSSITVLMKSHHGLGHPSRVSVTEQQLSATTSSWSLKTFVISCFLHFPMILIVSAKRQQLFSWGLSLEHIDSEQRMGASVCKTKEAASWGGPGTAGPGQSSGLAVPEATRGPGPQAPCQHAFWTWEFLESCC